MRGHLRVEQQSDNREEVLILVKAVPRPSQRYGETVCCAGVTLERTWRRLYPVRFRHLRDNQFNRWQWVSYCWRSPTSDTRRESRHVYEDSIAPGRQMPVGDRARFLEGIVRESAKDAESHRATLALVRPIDSHFRWKAKTPDRIEAE